MLIEKNIPVIDAREQANAARTIYPWKDMNVGDSFYAEVSPNALRTTAAHHTKRIGWTFKVAKEGGGARCWRVA